MNKIVGRNNELKSFGNYFFHKFSKSIEEYDWSERFWVIIRRFVRFGYDDRSGHFEIFGPMAKVDACISNVDDLGETIVIFDDKFPVTLCHLVRTWSRCVNTLADCRFEFVSGERIPGLMRFVCYFVENA